MMRSPLASHRAPDVGWVRQVSVPRTFREPGIQLYPGVHAIGPSRRGWGQGGYSRAYLFEDGDDLTLVDTLWDEDARMILAYLASIGRRPQEITRIAMTHAHRSHLGGLATIKRLSGAPVYSHAAEAPIIAGEQPAAKIPLRPLAPWQLVPFRVASQLGLQPHVGCPVDHPDLVEGSVLGGLKVLHLPGHTPGNLAFSWDDDKVLAVADTIMTWPEPLVAGWPNFNQDDDVFAESLERVLERNPKVVGTGHGDPIWENTARRISTLAP